MFTRSARPAMMKKSFQFFAEYGIDHRHVDLLAEAVRFFSIAATRTAMTM
ncbi:hypothetical protein ACVH9Z_19405 [Rhodococcus opacus]|nr:hypothetical protein [Rhodococcus opacus]NHU46199.1 hypothetical protein [Rhodococcus sp. A14]